MRKYLLNTGGILGVFLLSSSVFAQNISTETTSATIGSTQFGIVLTPENLGTFMQSTVSPSCAGPIDARICISLGADGLSGTSDDFVCLDSLPGSHTSSPFGTVSTEPNFACGPTSRSSECVTLMQNTNGTGGPQTAPDFTGRRLVGLIESDIVLGDGATAGMPDGFMRFTFDPATSDATIDQLIDHRIDFGGGIGMDFQQRSATIGAGNLIPDPIGDPLSLVAFPAPDMVTAADMGDTGMISRMDLAQGTADGFGALTLDVTTHFPAGIPGKLAFPGEGMFVTPGLNTGVDSTLIPGADRVGFP